MTFINFFLEKPFDWIQEVFHFRIKISRSLSFMKKRRTSFCIVNECEKVTDADWTEQYHNLKSLKNSVVWWCSCYFLTWNKTICELPGRKFPSWEDEKTHIKWKPVASIPLNRVDFLLFPKPLPVWWLVQSVGVVVTTRSMRFLTHTWFLFFHTQLTRAWLNNLDVN